MYTFVRGRKLSHYHNIDCITFKFKIMVNKTQTYIRVRTRSLLLESFSPAEAARVFDVDYRNMCAYLRGSKDIPLNLCFEVLDYLCAKVVIFRGI